MENYKVVDADQLNADLSAVADAIRERAGTEDTLAFPAGFVGAVEPLVNAEDYLAAVHNREVSEIVNHKMTGDIAGSWQKSNTNLSKVDLPLVSKLYSGAFLACSALADVNLPAVTQISADVFQLCYNIPSLYFPSLVNLVDWGWTFASCERLAKAYFPKLTTITGGSFSNCRRMTTLILGSDTVCRLESTNVFTETPIAGFTVATDGEMGYVYVPSALVDSYKSATNWSVFASQIRAIEDYPEVLEGWE